jgi:hypothetical protein
MFPQVEFKNNSRQRIKVEFDAVINLSAPTFIAVLERSLTSPKWIGGLKTGP